MYNRSVAVVRAILSRKPDATIMLSSGTKEGALWLHGSDNQHERGTTALRRAYATLINESPQASLHFVDADEIYAQPDDDVFWEFTVMGTHPTSLGMERFTRYWSPLLKSILEPEEVYVPERGMAPEDYDQRELRI